MQETEETQVRSLGLEHPLEEGMATHSSILAWRIPWAEDLGGLQSMRSQRVTDEWSDLAHMHFCSREYNSFFFFDWGIVAFQYCFSFCCTMKSINISIHISPPSWTSLLPTPIPLLWVIRKHCAELPVLCSTFPQASYSVYISIPILIETLNKVFFFCK